MFKIFAFIKKWLLTDKTKNDSCEFDVENRAYYNLSERYDNLDELPQQENEAGDIRKKSLLRIIKTLRGEEEIEDAINSGQKVLKQKVKPLENIHVTDLHIKNKKTGKVTVEPYSFHNFPDATSDCKIVKEVTYYPYKFPPTAAYLLPDDIEVGERVILDDLIKDIVGASHPWGRYRLNNTEAIWNGEGFIVDRNSYAVHTTFG